MQTSISQFELAHFYYKTGDFKTALVLFNQLLQKSQLESDWDTYLKAVPLVLRIYAEQLNFDDLNQLVQQFEQIKARFDLTPTAQFCYTLGICHAYAGRTSSAQTCFQQCLDLAKKNQNIEWIAKARHGIGMCFSGMNLFEQALSELEAVEQHLQKVELLDLDVAVQIAKGLVYRSLERYDLAKMSLKNAQEILVKNPSWYMQINLLYAFGSLYFKMGEVERGEFYFEMAKSMVDPSQYQHTALQIENQLHEIKKIRGQDFDLMIRRIPYLQVIEKSKGTIDFGKQLVLFDLLELFSRHPGRLFSKEEIVRRIWDEEYNPKVHDNKLFVTMRRLRKLIEVDGRRPRYVLRARGGYFFNDQARVISSEEGNV